MQKKILSRQRRYERGQTIILVAISLVSLLAMAALAIDIVTLYVARSEIQRAADAAALAGAKAIADSSITTLVLTDANFATVQVWAQSAATAQVNAVLQNNLVAGVAPGLVSATVDWTHQGNPHITVNLQRTGLPTFFSKIWAGTAAKVTATATAEAYNPANLPTTTPITPIAPRSVKPWLVANADPTLITTPKFVDTTTWLVDSSVIGKSFNLTADCQSGPPTCQLITAPTNRNPPIASNSTLQVDYVPAKVTPTNSQNVCPPCAGATDYEQTIECADANAYTVLNCGGGATNATWDNSNVPGGPTGLSASGAECLIHASTSGQSRGQDILNDPGPWPAAPFQILAGPSNPQNGSLITTSNSIVTIPIIDNSAPLITNGNVTIVGFMQAFINWVQDGSVPNTTAGDVNITVLNIAGCSSSNNGANPVVGGSGTSPVPVRLITAP
jgi:hypothetical protein